MYLAGILGLCALLHVPAYGGVHGDVLLFERPSASLAQQSQPPQQENQNPPAGEAPSTPPKPDAAAPSEPQDQPAQEKPPTTSTTPGPDQVKPEPEGTKPAAGVSSKKPKKKKSHPAQAGEEPQKRVVHRGGTVEPTTQLGPGLTDEQAAKQRQTTNQLLASTDAALQKLSGRQLTKDEQDTVAQIRRFTQQAKAADAAGDLPRASKLAVKARLLSDALAKP